MFCDLLLDGTLNNEILGLLRLYRMVLLLTSA